MKNKKVLKIGAYSVTLSAIVLAVVIAVNLFASQLPAKFLRPDLTPEKLTTIGDETKEILKGVKDDITFFYVVSDGYEDPDIKRLAESYADECDKITIEYVDPAKNPTFLENYPTVTAHNSIIVKTDKRFTVINGSDFFKNEIVGYEGTYYSDSEFDSVSQQYSYYTGQEPESNRYFFGENELTGAVDYVISDNIPVLYCLSGHGETDISAGAFGGLIKDENIELKTLSLASGEKIEVPSDAGAVIIVSPATDISEDEAKALNTYVDGGGKIVLLTNYQACTADTVPNLANVCEHMGLEAKADLIADNDPAHYSQAQYVMLPEITGNGFTSLMENRDVYMYMPYSHAIETSGTNADVEAYSVLETSESGFILNEKSAADPESAAKSVYSLCYQTVNAEDGTLIWAGTPLLLDDSLANSGNANFVISMLQSMFEKTSSVSIIGKPVQSSSLDVPESGVMTWAVVFVVISLAVLAAGIAVYVIRRRK